jgi:hypothetical protein
MDSTVPIELPVIDISNPHDPAVGKAMLDAAAKYGFLYVNSKGTDFTVEDVDHAFGLVKFPFQSTSIYTASNDLHSQRSSFHLPHRRKRHARSSRMFVTKRQTNIFNLTSIYRTGAGLECIQKPLTPSISG